MQFTNDCFSYESHRTRLHICEQRVNIVCNSVEITNKMQPCLTIYYSTVHWRLNMLRTAYSSSSEALTVFAASGLHTHSDLTTAGHHMRMKTRGCKYS